MLKCECGWEATVLHTWSSVFTEIYFYEISLKEGTAQVICPGCHQYVFSDKAPHERANTQHEVDTKGIELWGLEPELKIGGYGEELPPARFEVIPFIFDGLDLAKSIAEGQAYVRLIPGGNGKPGKIELVREAKSTPSTKGERIAEMAFDPATDRIFDNPESKPVAKPVKKVQPEVQWDPVQIPKESSLEKASYSDMI